MEAIKKTAIYFCKISPIAIHCEYYIFEYLDLVFSLLKSAGFIWQVVVEHKIISEPLIGKI